MTNTLIDLSNKSDLAWISRLLADVRTLAPVAKCLLAGAQARDLLLMHAYGIPTGRATVDVDLAFLVADWNEFLSLRQALIDSGKFLPTDRVLNKLRHTGVGSTRLDIIPFAGVEDENRQIAWPPDYASMMNVIGFREAFDAAILVDLPENQHVKVVSLCGLTLLKLAAWKDRRLQYPQGKDAQDLRLILKNYLDAGNTDRLYTEGSHLLEMPDFEYETAGAWLLGQDAGRLVGPLKAVAPANARAFYTELLHEEIDAGVDSKLLQDMRTETPANDLRLLRSFVDGFEASAPL